MDEDLYHMEDDPVLGDEDDPEYEEEMFETYKEMGWGPEDLAAADDEYRKRYAEWLQKQAK